MPKYIKNENCILIHDVYKFDDKYNRTNEIDKYEENIRICDIYYSKLYHRYYYSYQTKRAFCRWAGDINLKKLKKN